MRLSVLPPPLLLHLLIAITPVQSLDLDFSDYPKSTQTCLQNAAGISGCAGETVAEENQCLCSNTGNFVTNTAMCIADQGETILSEVWDLLHEACSKTRTPLEISEADYFEAGSTETTVTSTITTTRAGTLTTYTTTSTSTHAAGAAATTTAASEPDDDSDQSDMLVSARVGAITATVTGIMGIVLFALLLVLLRKYKIDKELLRQPQEGARAGDRYRGPDKPLLNPGSVTPAFMSPANPEPGRHFGASVVPPTPSYAGPLSPAHWPSGQIQQQHGDRGIPSQVPSHAPTQATHWPSPVLSQGVNTGTMGSWCPSPLSAGPSSNVLGMYSNGGAGTIGGIDTTIGSTLARQITVSTAHTRSSWAHDRPEDELCEMPGNEHRDPVEADSTPVAMPPERLSMRTSPAPPGYEPGAWNDPITDKPPSGWI